MNDSRAAEQRYGYALVATMVAGLMLVASAFDDFGVTWDEPYHELYGTHLRAYYASWFADRSALTYHNLWLYGGAFDLPVAILKTVSPFGSYETAHLANGLVGLLGVLGAARIGSLIGGPRAGLAAAVLLIITPSWLGHMFFNPKDIPFATGMTWTLYYSMRFARDFPDASAGLCWRLGIALGLTLGVRISGAIALLYVGLALLAWGGLTGARCGLARACRDGLRGMATRLLPALVIAYVVMVAVWPWAQQDPLRNPFVALRIFSNSPWDLDVLFAGRLVNSLSLPASYLPVYLAVKLPEIVLLLLACAAVTLGAALLRGRHQRLWRDIAPVGLLVTAVVFPLVFFLTFRPITYDGIRHFLFVLPPIAVSAALGLEALLSRMPAGSVARFAAVAVAVGYGAWHGATIVRLHPHEYVYFNRLVGGVAGAEKRFELDYWGNSYREAVEGLVAFLDKDKSDRRGVPWRVLVCSAGTSASYFFPATLVLATDETDADFYIASTRLGCDEEYEGDVIVKVARDGAVLSVVKDRRKLRGLPERLGPRLARSSPARQHPGLDAAGAAGRR